jgi:hypothetical protein
MQNFILHIESFILGVILWIIGIFGMNYAQKIANNDYGEIAIKFIAIFVVSISLILKALGLIFFLLGMFYLVKDLLSIKKNKIDKKVTD